LATAALSIKLRCGSWQQLATIYKRDLSRGSMFLKASSQPPLGTQVRIDLELPSATVIELLGTITNHVVDPQRGTGVDLKLEPLPTKTVWLIESALAAETKVRAKTADPSRPPTAPPVEPPPPAERSDLGEAETELVRALEAEAESLRKLNPFLVLGVGYETTDADVRAAFGELTKRYHPDRFARYQSSQLRALAAEIFILIRDAYRKLADENSRAQALAAIRSSAPKFARAGTPPPLPPPPAAPLARAKTPPPILKISVPAAIPPRPAAPGPHDAPTSQNAHDAPTNPCKKSAELAHTELAKSDLAIPTAPRRNTPAGGVERVPDPARRSVPIERPADASRGATPVSGVEREHKSGPIRAPAAATAPMNAGAPKVDTDNATDADALIDQGRLDEALSAYRIASKKHPNERAYRAGIELVEGLKALEQRDRMEAAQRFEAALELDPSNERAARELAEMRRQATNERKGLLSRLMGKKEGPP
jgi:tetratricopeptide (TPR) repeat protein